jgi:integrase
MNLTVSNIARLKLGPDESDRIFFDDAVPGFGLRMRASGANSWVYQYKLGRKTRRITIAVATAIPLGRAKALAGELHAKVRLGGDPAGEKRQAIARAANTLVILVDDYLARQQTQLRPRSLKEMSRHLRLYAAPLHALAVDTIDQRSIADRLSAIERDSGAVTANRVQASLSAMFAWAMREGRAKSNPAALTHKRQERPRDRVLSDAELGLIWRALGDDHYSIIVKLLMLTGQRLSEITALRWSEIDFDRGVISLPAGRTKNHRAHDIPITPTMAALLRAQSKRGDLVFGRGVSGYAGAGHSKERLDMALTIQPWTHHDLRRTAATGMSNIGVQPHVVEAVLNHVSGHKGGVAGIYNKSTYAAEKADALARWDAHILALVSNVTPPASARSGNPSRARP